MDSAPEESLDRLTRLAARLLDVPVALIAFVDEHRQYFKSATGLDAREAPLSHSFCQHVVAEQSPVIIADARLDPRVRDNPGRAEMNVVAYAGVPLTTTEGQTLGSFSVLDHSPRQWSDEDIQLLVELAHGAMSEIELRLANHELREAEERFRRTFEHAPIGMALVSPDGRWLQVNRALCEIVGYSEPELVQLTFQDITHPDDLPTDLVYVRQLLADEIRGYQMEKRYLHKDGREIWIKLSVSMVREPTGEPLYFVSQIEDVTAARQAGEALREAERQARRERDYAAAITSSMREGVLLTRDGSIIDVNQALCDLTGYTRDELIGKHVPYPFWAPESVEEIQAHRNGIRPGAHDQLETGYMRKDGRRVEVSLNTIVVTTAGGESLGYLTTVHDITEQKRYRAELERLASRDSLTGLLNRRVFMYQLRTEIALAQRHERPLSVVMFDLDRFKAINDRRGHPIGDKVLREAADRLRRVTRDGDHLARVGGEEFAWILPDASSAAACVAAERARLAIASESFSEGESVTLSAGVCQLADDGDAETLYQFADEALYQAKQRGRNQTYCYGVEGPVE